MAVVDIGRTSCQTSDTDDGSAYHGILWSREPDNRTVTHLGENERHRSQTCEGADIILADLSASVVDDRDNLREHKREAVVHASGDTCVPCRGLEAYVLEEVQWEVCIPTSFRDEDFIRRQDGEERQKADDHGGDHVG